MRFGRRDPNSPWANMMERDRQQRIALAKDDALLRPHSGEWKDKHGGTRYTIEGRDVGQAVFEAWKTKGGISS